MSTIRDVIEQARAAQQANAQSHDVQLEIGSDEFNVSPISPYDVSHDQEEQPDDA